MKILAIAGLAFVFSLVNQTFAQHEQHTERPARQDNQSSAWAYEGDQQTAADRPEHHKNEQGYIRRLLNFLEQHDALIVSVGTVALVVVTAALAAVTGLLWIATRALVQGAEATAERQLRAYVLLTKGLVKIFGEGMPVTVALIIKNTGLTPAYDYSLTSTIDVGEIPRNEFVSRSPNESDLVSKSTIGPGAKVSAPRSLLKPLEKKTYEQIIRRELGVYVFGQITYRDAFQKPRWSNFRYLVTWQQDGSGIGLTPLSEGNDSN